MFGLNPAVIELFTPFFEYVNGRLLFKYSFNTVESWEPGLHHVPTTLGLWLTDVGHSNIVTELYIGYSAMELFCFASQHSFNLLKNKEQVAFAAIGLLPSPEQVDDLKTAFPFARWHLLFGPDLLGRIADAAIASWYKKRLVSFLIRSDAVTINYSGKIYLTNTQIFSLNRFEHQTGLRAGMRTHKPPRGLSSFIELQSPNYDP